MKILHLLMRLVALITGLLQPTSSISPGFQTKAAQKIPGTPEAFLIGFEVSYASINFSSLT